MKTQVLADLEKYFSSYLLNIVHNPDCDLFVQHNFLNKKWLGGSKTIQYELLIGIDAKDSIVYVLEKVIEKGYGFSFGFKSSSYSQKGTKVYRKVKEQQIGLDDVAYVVDLDLGFILKEIENIARKHHFEFKEVLSPSKIKEAHLT